MFNKSDYKTTKAFSLLKAIKSIVDFYYDNKNKYDMDVIMGMISNHTYDALGLNIPSRKEKAHGSN